MAEDDSLGGRGDGEIAHVTASLSAAKDHDSRVLTELLTLLQVLGMQDGRHVLYASDVGDMSLGVDA